MSAVQEARKEITAINEERKPRASVSFTTRLMNQLSSVRFGVILLILLAVACMVGMIIMQQSVQGFDKYYAELTPAQKVVYGGLGFFDIYHTWYFNVLLMTLSLNIVLSSIDHFPSAWKFISHKKLDATRAYVLSQKLSDTIRVRCESREAVVERIRAACRQVGWRVRVAEKNERAVVFAERGAWNRLGAYGVHVALLMVFLGFFMTAQYGQTGQMPLTPGMSSSEMTGLAFHLDQVSETTMRLPFTVTCTDVQQKLINKDGSLSAMNTMDWLTRIRITDETGSHDALVHLNAPLDYRGYRFFQSSFNSTGNARTITLELKPQQGGEPLEVTVPRNGSAKLADETVIEYLNFFPDFILQGANPDTASDEYNNPAAQLGITTPDGQAKMVYAFASDVPDNAPVGAPFGGYKFKLKSFEKAATAHILSVQHDPGRIPFYAGGALLILTLCAVFFFSHQRVWAIVGEREAGTFEVVLGGDTNRSKLNFEDRFKRMTSSIIGQTDTDKAQQS
jgi:cytochrome c biogenesis protein